MKNYIQYQITDGNGPEREILIATLADFGFEGFEETDETLTATTQEGQVNLSELETWLREGGLKFSRILVQEQNWNALWESNFSPVVVDDFAGVRAHFHAPNPGVTYDLLITPKMSFGTGHHATTWQMMKLMQQLPVKGSRVFDFGTGTGVLAILAEKMGAAEVVAIDNDAWSIENASENIKNNACSAISLFQADAVRGYPPFDIVLANINKHILLENLEDLERLVKPGGYLLLSGLLSDDEKDIADAYESVEFTREITSTRNGWIAILFTKKCP